MIEPARSYSPSQIFTARHIAVVNFLHSPTPAVTQTILPSPYLSSLRSRCSPIVVHPRACSVVAQTIIRVVDLGAPLLQHTNHVIERTQSVFVCGTAGVRAVDGHDGVVTVKWRWSANGYGKGCTGGDVHNESNLLAGALGRALQHLGREVGCEWDQSARDE